MRTEQTLLVTLLALASCGPADLEVTPFEPTMQRSMGSVPERTKARGIVLVVIDTLRADHVDWNDAEGSTPELATLARGGVVFTEGYSTSSWTRPAMGSLLCGRYPSELGLHSYEDSLPESGDNLAVLLTAAGVKTLAVSANANAGSKWGFARGFDEFLEPEQSAFYEQDEQGMIPAEVVTLAGLRLLDGLEPDEPFLLLLHYTDPHDPYFPHAELSGSEPAGTFDGSRADLTRLDQLGAPERAEAEQRIKFLYQGEVQYVDHWVGQLVDGLRERGVFDESLLVVTSDHGEGLWDHGERAHGRKLYEEQIHVPFMVRFPQAWGAAPAQSSELASLVDLGPTILAAMGLEAPAAWHGGDLWRAVKLGEPQRTEVFAEIDFVGVYYQSLRHGNWKSLRNSAHDEVFRDRTHTVREGDTLWTIAYIYYGPSGAQALADANPLVFPEGTPLIDVQLQVGTELVLPPVPIPEGELHAEVFDLGSDPQELNAVGAGEERDAQRARARGVQLWSQQQVRAQQGGAQQGGGNVALDEEARAKLRGLGYVE